MTCMTESVQANILLKVCLSGLLSSPAYCCYGFSTLFHAWFPGTSKSIRCRSMSHNRSDATNTACHILNKAPAHAAATCCCSCWLCDTRSCSCSFAEAACASALVQRATCWASVSCAVGVHVHEQPVSPPQFIHIHPIRLHSSGHLEGVITGLSGAT